MSTAGSKKSNEVTPGVAIFVIALIGLGAWAFTSCEPGDYSSADARVACQDKIEARLKSPATADFGGVTTAGDKDNGYTVRGHVDSQNGFGATVRSQFSCRVTFTGDTATATVTGLE